MDAATAARLTTVAGREIVGARSLGGQHGVAHYRLQFADGAVAFAKVQNPHSAGNGVAGFSAEAAALRWLAAAEAVPVPLILGCDAHCLITEWVDAGAPRPAAASQFGRELAALHRAGSERFGAPWPGVIAGLELPNEAADSWPEWYLANRVQPYARLARDAGTLTTADVALTESAGARSPTLAGPPEPPSRIHGDCWSGSALSLVDGAATRTYFEPFRSSALLAHRPYDS